MKYLITPNVFGRIIRVALLITSMIATLIAIVLLILDNADVALMFVVPAIISSEFAFFADKYVPSLPYTESEQFEIHKRNFLSAMFWNFRRHWLLETRISVVIGMIVMVFVPSICLSLVKTYSEDSVFPFLISGILLSVAMVILNIYLIIRSAK